MSDNFFEQLKIYLGKYDVPFSKKESKYFDALNLQKKSYVAFSTSYKTLKKFVNTFLLYTNNDYYSYITFTVGELLDYKFSNTPLPCPELMIIVYHKNTIETGNTESYIKDVLLDIVGNRNRLENCYTLILTEKNLKYFEKIEDEIEMVYLRTDDIKGVGKFTSTPQSISTNGAVY